MNDIALIQMNSSSKVAQNLQLAEHLLTEASQNQAQLAVLPENFAQMPLTEKQRLEAAEAPGSGPIQDFLSKMSAALNLWILPARSQLQLTNKTKFTVAALVTITICKCVNRYDNNIYLTLI